jgi:hypothetical protein
MNKRNNKGRERVNDGNVRPVLAWLVTGQSFVRQDNTPIGGVRSEYVNTDNPLFATCTTEQEVQQHYESFWNNLCLNSKYILKVSSVRSLQQRTCEIELLRMGAPFVWGDVIALHDIGPYDIVEYAARETNSVGFKASTVVRFHPYIQGWDTSHSYSTLDDALLACVALRHDGINTQAPQLFSRSLGISEHQNEQGAWNWIAKMLAAR